MKINLPSWERMGRPGIEIRLNGLTINTCVAADEENGFIIHYKKDPLTGITKNDGKQCISYKSFGDVQIILGDDVRKI